MSYNLSYFLQSDLLLQLALISYNLTLLLSGLSGRHFVYSVGWLSTQIHCDASVPRWKPIQ